MTIKEISDFTGKEIRTIRRWIAKTGDKMSQVTHDKMSQGTPKDYTLDEVEAILIEGSLSKDAIAVLMDNARNKNSVALPTPKMFEKIILSIMTPLMEKMEKSISSKLLTQKQLAAPEKTDKEKLREAVNVYANTFVKNNYKEAEYLLYVELYTRLNVNIYTYENRKNKRCFIDCVAHEGLLLDALSLLHKMTAEELNK
ncbi:MAG: hypothetical protein PF518_04825 [Spirochaetaceae bacterium]|jgi:hypothetical protein|nr:hypothetical protein [Spirochaetaceae bacterium]